MKHPFFVIALIFMARTSCNNNVKVNQPSDDPVNIIDDSTGQVSNPSYDPARVAADTTGFTNPLVNPANLIVDSTGQVNTSLEDPAKLIIATDPLEKRLNPAHGEPGHRCDVPVGADISAMPKAIGMSLCK